MGSPRHHPDSAPTAGEASPTVLTESAIVQVLIEQDLDRLREEIDRVLAGLPERRLEARRRITCELGFEPRPEVLQTIVKMAQNDRPGAAREIARRLLAVSVLIDRELKAVFEPRQIEIEILERSRNLLPELRSLAKREEDAFGRVVEALSLSDREFLLPIVEVLTPPYDVLLAAEVLVPRLQQMAECARTGELRAAFPVLTDSEVATLGAAVGSPGSVPAPSRVLVDATAMRTIIHDDLADWEAQQIFDDEELTESEEHHERLLRDKAAYQVVARRLQEQLDNALVAGLDPFAEEMRQVKRNLFATYLKLSPAIRSDETGWGDDADAQLRLSEEVIERVREAEHEAEQEAERVQGSRVVKEELYLNALDSMRKPVEKPRDQPVVAELRRQRRRTRTLAGVAVILFISVVVVYLVLPGVSSMRTNVYPSTFQQTLPVTDVTIAGPMVFAEVSSWYWKELERPEKLHKLEELGKRAARRDYQMLYLMDEESEQLGVWSISKGARLPD
jgi:hypothetical protein